MATAANRVLESALLYAERGWFVVPLYGTTQPDVCECKSKSKCRSAGKHPRIKEWQKNASRDERQIEEWFDRWPGSNIGVLLGPKSGIVDIEFDTAQGEETAKQYLGDCFTPSFKSKRSVHRLFRWDESLPNVESDDGKIELLGLELRLGSRVKGFQSVFPPSQHGTGVKYQWLPGLSPDEVEIQEVPGPVISWLQAWAENNGRPVLASSERREYLHSTTEIWETKDGRNDTLYSEACGLWRKEARLKGRRAFDDHKTHAELYSYVWSLSQAKCKPPLEERELNQLFESAKLFIGRNLESGHTTAKSNLTQIGLEFRDGEWFPGSWECEIVESDPAEVRLFLPNVDGPVEMSMKAFDSPGDVHLAVLEKSRGRVCLADRPKFWPSVWNGFTEKNDDGHAITHVGVKAKMLEDARRVEAPAERRRFYMVCSYLWEKVGESQLLAEGANPTKMQTSFLDQSGNIWFRFNSILHEAQFEAREITRPILSRTLRELGAKSRQRNSSDKRQWFILTKPIQKEIQDILTNSLDKEENE